VSSVQGAGYDGAGFVSHLPRLGGQKNRRPTPGEGWPGDQPLGRRLCPHCKWPLECGTFWPSHPRLVRYKQDVENAQYFRRTKVS